MPEDRLSLIVDTPGSQSIKDLRDQYKQLKATVSELPVGSAEFKAGAEAAGQLNGRIKDLNYQMNGLSGAVRQARTEKRMWRFAVMEMIGGLDGLATSIDSVTGQTGEGKGLKGFEKSLTGALGAGMGLKFGLEMLGGAAAQYAGPAGVALGVTTLIASAMGNASEETKKLKEEIEKLGEETYKQRVKLGLVGPGQNAQDLQSGLTAAIKDRQKLIQTPASKVTETYDVAYGGIKRVEEVDLERKKKILELDKKIFDLQQQLADVNTKRAEATQKQVDDYLENNKKEIEEVKKREKEETQAFLDGIKTRSEAFTRAQEQGRLGISFGGRGEKIGFNQGIGMQNAIRSLYSGTPKNVESLSLMDIQGLKGVNQDSKGFNVDKLGETLDKAEEKGTLFKNTLVDGFRQATNELARGLESALNLGNNLAGKLVGTLLSVFLQVGANALTAGLGSLLGVGVSAAGAGGPSITNAIGQAARFGGGAAASSISIVPIIDNAGLAVQVAVGQRVNSAGRTLG